MTISRVRLIALLWFVGSLAALGAVLPSVSSVTSNLGAALLFGVYLQATRLLGGILVSGWTRRTNAKPFRGTSGTVDRIPVQAVWVLNRVTTFVGAEEVKSGLEANAKAWKAHQDAHKRAAHGWLATIGQSIGTVLVTWLFLTIGPLTSILAMLLWVLALIVALSAIDHLLRMTLDVALSSTSAVSAPDVSVSIAAWRDIAINPPVCRWAAGVIHADAAEAEPRA